MKKIQDKVLIYLYGFCFVFVSEGIISFLEEKKATSILVALLFGCAFVFLSKKMKSIHLTEIKEKYEGEKWDRYFKQLMNCIYLLVWLILFVAVTFLVELVWGNAKPLELLASLRSTILVAEYVVMFILIFQKELHLHAGSKDIAAARRYICLQLTVIFVLWILYLILIRILGLQFFYGSFLLFSGLYIVAAVISNLTLRRQITNRNFIWKKRYTVIILSYVILRSGFAYLKRDTFYLQRQINQMARLHQNTVPIQYDDETGIYRLTMTGSDFKILQLTDLHFGGSLTSLNKDKKALEAVYDLIEYTRPDLVIVTGDMTYPVGISSFSLNNSSAVQQFAAFMRNINVPWAFTFGNHDTEILASLDKENLCKLYESLSFKTSGTLLYPYRQPAVTGRNNQVIELYNADGSLNQALFLIDSNAYTGKGYSVYDCIHEDQVDWYESEVLRLNEQEGKTVSSLAFFHIPLQEYRTASELYYDGSNEVTWYFGQNDEKDHKVCCSDTPSDLFERMKELDSTKAVFCGHDHYNNMSLEYQGIRLTYGMSIDYLAYYGIEKSYSQRGGTLITIGNDSSYTIEQVPLMAISTAAR